MKACDRGRNVKSKELFGCFDEIFISIWYRIVSYRIITGCLAHGHLMTHRYNFVSQNMNWTAAQSYCQTWHDAKLAIIANVADQLRLQTYLDLVDCKYTSRAGV